MTRPSGVDTAGPLTIVYKIHNNLVTTDKNKYLSEASRGNRSTRSHPFQYHRLNTDGLKFSFFPRTIASWNRLTTEPVSAGTLDWMSVPEDRL